MTSTILARTGQIGRPGQQRVPAVSCGFGVEDVLVEVSFKGAAALPVGADRGAQAVLDPPGAGDYADPRGDLFGGAVVAAAGLALELVQILGGTGEAPGPHAAGRAGRALPH